MSSMLTKHEHLCHFIHLNTITRNIKLRLHPTYRSFWPAGREDRLPIDRQSYPSLALSSRTTWRIRSSGGSTRTCGPPFRVCEWAWLRLISRKKTSTWWLFFNSWTKFAIGLTNRPAELAFDANRAIRDWFVNRSPQLYWSKRWKKNEKAVSELTWDCRLHMGSRWYGHTRRRPPSDGDSDGSTRDSSESTGRMTDCWTDRLFYFQNRYEPLAFSMQFSSPLATEHFRM